jgi:hypothetical protein
MADDRLTALGCLADWREVARHEIELIGGWRDKPAERIWHGGWPESPIPSKLPTILVGGWILANHPTLDVAALYDVDSLIGVWYADHDADRLPEQDELVRILERALIVVGIAESATLRAVEDGKNDDEITANQNRETVRPANEERDKWLYDERTKRPPTSYKQLVGMFADMPESWEKLDNPPAIFKAIRRYCNRHPELPRPPAGKRGRQRRR